VNSVELTGNKQGSAEGFWAYSDNFRIHKSREILEQLKIHEIQRDGPIS
jgi:hypothetical protein